MASPVIGHPLAHAAVAVTEPDAGALQRAAHLLQTATRPVLLVGNGVVRQGASQALRDFCRQTGLHVITTFMGKGVVDSADEHFLFTAGLRAQDYPQGLMGRADLVVMCVGYDMVEWPPSAWNPDGRQKIICVDTVPPEIDAHYVPEVELIGNLSHILTQLGCLLWNKPMASFEVPPVPARLLDAARLGHGRRLPGQAAARAARPAHRARRRTTSSSRTSAPTSSGWRASGRPAEPNTVLISNGFAAMGFALPAAIAASLATQRPPQGRRGLRRRRLPHERAGAGDGASGSGCRSSSSSGATAATASSRCTSAASSGASRARASTIPTSSALARAFGVEGAPRGARRRSSARAEQGTHGTAAPWCLTYR